MRSDSTPAPCAPPKPDEAGPTAPTQVLRSLNAMGCRFELILDTQGSLLDTDQLNAVADDLTELIQDWHDRLTAFAPGSITSMINAAPPGTPIPVDHDMTDLLRLCEQARTITHGAFNIAAGSLMHEHGFRARHTQRPTDTKQDLANAFTIDTQTRTITRNHEHASLDFGAIAKGFVLDLIRDQLTEHGVRRAFVHGGSSSAIGISEPHEPKQWRIRLSQAHTMDAALNNTALAVSEHSGRSNDQGLGHLMDPTSGTPVRNSITRTVCVHTSAALADAYATALSVRPDLAPNLHDNGCSVILFDHTNPPRVFDTQGAFSAARPNDPSSKPPTGTTHV